MTPERGWILFDGACGFCARWVPFWGPWLRRQGYGFRALQDPWVREHAALDEAALLTDLRLLRADGVLVSGAEVYREVLGASPWTRPLAHLTRLPGFSHLFEGGYRLFARHRYRVSQACGWQPREPMDRKD